jgi:hypothetical protein
MIARIYSLEEVNGMLPLVRSIVTEATECAALIKRYTDGAPASESTADGLSEGALLRLYDLNRCKRELEALGAYLRDADSGLVEWYGEVGGDIIYLSWTPEDETVHHWRGLYSRSTARRHLGVVS